MTTTQCTGCAVQQGTHQPAEALHQQIDEPRSEAMRLADECEESAIHWVHEIDTRFKAAKMLRDQHARIAELESQLDAIGAGGVEPLSKGFVRLADVLARLEQGFGANSAPATTIKRHFEMQAHPTQQGLEQANCKSGNWLTVVYRDIRPGDEARTIGEHPKVSALSWSHALNERDAALAAQAKQEAQ